MDIFHERLHPMENADNVVQIDSLIANEFALEINGEQVSGVLQITDLVSYATDAGGSRVKPPFVVSKMVERDGNNAFNTWLRETVAERDSDEKPRRDVTVVAVDDGVETRRWKAVNAWIMGVSYSNFDSASIEIVAERITIGYDDIEESFPTTDG